MRTLETYTMSDIVSPLIVLSDQDNMTAGADVRCASLFLLLAKRWKLQRVCYRQAAMSTTSRRGQVNTHGRYSRVSRLLAKLIMASPPSQQIFRQPPERGRR